jgi:alkylation response protein AidB-like acyl-CoA dehydrogenase
MRLSDSPEEAAWRAEVREFLATMPPEIRVRSRLVTGMSIEGKAGLEVEGRPEARPGGAGFVLEEDGPEAEWRRKLAERGWLAPAWPKRYGGAELTKLQQYILEEEFAEAGAPQLGGMGVSMIGPTLIVHGTEEQKAEHLPKILRGETIWCQGFSEPGSGSDLASLQTSAVRDGDEYVINGQKIWTSNAQYANWMFMLARTDFEAPKHRGITYFMMDFRSPGITVQPLLQIAGNAGFNQVFFDNVRVPLKNVVGDVNRGWYIGTTTLDFERGGIGSAVGTKHNVEGIIEFARSSGMSALGTNPALRYDLIDRYVEAEVSQMLAYRVQHMQNVGLIPNHEASIAKLYGSELMQRIARTAMKTVGLYGLTWERESAYAPSKADYSRAYVQSLGNTIAGGTSEIQRNIIAQRGLGMPRD